MDTAASGVEAIHRLVDQPYDLVITDLVMPNVDGATLCRIIRSEPKWSHIKLILVSAIAAEAEGDFLRIPADAHVAKSRSSTMPDLLSQAVTAVDGGEIPAGVIGLDSVYKRRISQELLWENRQLRSAIDGMLEGVILTTPEGEIVGSNSAGLAMIQVSLRHALGKNLSDMAPRLNELSEGESKRVEIGGRVFESRRQQIYDHDRTVSMFMLRDVTEADAAQKGLEKAIEDRDMLIREVHHRVKNNLFTVASYLSLQRDAAELPETQKTLEEVEAHLGAIVRVHDRLYRTANHARQISTAEYVSDLVGDLLNLGGHDNKAELDLSLDDVRLSPKATVVLGLILAELMTNAFRHAAPRTDNFALRIALRREGGFVLFEFADNGPGLPNGVLTGERQSLGLTLIDSFAQQLRATVDISSGDGARYVLTIPAEK